MTFSMPPSSYRTLPPERRGVRAADLVVTVVLLVLLAGFAFVAMTAGFLLVMATDSCSPATCDFGLLNAGMWFGAIAPWVMFVLAVAAAIVRLVARRTAFWVPLLAAGLMVVLWFVAAAMVGAGIGGSG